MMLNKRVGIKVNHTRVASLLAATKGSTSTIC
jgi:hypothetical protein